MFYGIRYVCKIELKLIRLINLIEVVFIGVMIFLIIIGFIIMIECKIKKNK